MINIEWAMKSGCYRRRILSLFLNQLLSPRKIFAHINMQVTLLQCGIGNRVVADLDPVPKGGIRS